MRRGIEENYIALCVGPSPICLRSPLQPPNIPDLLCWVRLDIAALGGPGKNNRKHRLNIVCEPPTMFGRRLIANANNQSTVEQDQTGFRDWFQIIETPLLIGSGARCKVEKRRAGAIFGNDASQCARLRASRYFCQSGDASALGKKFGRANGRFREVNGNPSGSMVAAHFAVPVSKNLKSSYTNCSHRSLATIASAVSSLPSFFKLSIHLSRSSTSHSKSPSAISIGRTGHCAANFLADRRQ